MDWIDDDDEIEEGDEWKYEEDTITDSGEFVFPPKRKDIQDWKSGALEEEYDVVYLWRDERLTLIPDFQYEPYIQAWAQPPERPLVIPVRLQFKKEFMLVDEMTDFSAAIATEKGKLTVCPHCNARLTLLFRGRAVKKQPRWWLRLKSLFGIKLKYAVICQNCFAVIGWEKKGEEYIRLRKKYADHQEI